MRIAVTRFKGTDRAFETFPNQLQDLLSKSIDNAVTECIVYPKYEVGPYINVPLLLRLMISPDL